MNPNIPAVVCPKESGTYKVVQFLDNANNHYLRIAPSGNPNASHKEIVSEFLNEAGIEKCIKDQIVYPTTKDIEIEGAARVQISLEHKTAEFFGFSMDYPIELNKASLEALGQAYPEWNISYDPRRYE